MYFSSRLESYVYKHLKTLCGFLTSKIDDRWSRNYHKVQSRFKTYDQGWIVFLIKFICLQIFKDTNVNHIAYEA